MSNFRRALMMRKSNPGDSSGDIPLKYIASCRKNYVDTEYYVQNTDRIVCEITYVAKAKSTSDECQPYFGARVSTTSQLCIFRLRNKTGHGLEAYRANKDSVSRWTAVTSNNDYTFVFNTSSFALYKADGTTVSKATTGTYVATTPPVSLYLFNINQGDAPSQDKTEYVKIRRFYVEESGVKVFELIPVLHNGEPCFYETISGTYRMFTMGTPSQDVRYEIKD